MLLHLLHHPLGRVGCGNRTRRGYRGVNLHLLGVLNARQALPALQLLIFHHALEAGEAGGSGRAPGERLFIRRRDLLTARGQLAARRRRHHDASRRRVLGA